MTSNIGVRTANDFGNGIGFNTNINKNKKDILKKELNKEFPPEFLNRIDEIITFNPLSKEVCVKIVDKMLNELKKRLYENKKGNLYGCFRSPKPLRESERKFNYGLRKGIPAPPR